MDSCFYSLNKHPPKACESLAQCCFVFTHVESFSDGRYVSQIQVIALYMNLGCTKQLLYALYKVHCTQPRAHTASIDM